MRAEQLTSEELNRREMKRQSDLLVVKEVLPKLRLSLIYFNNVEDCLWPWTCLEVTLLSAARPRTLVYRKRNDSLHAASSEHVRILQRGP
jgi:hypothetical protein